MGNCSANEFIDYHAETSNKAKSEMNLISLKQTRKVNLNSRLSSPKKKINNRENNDTIVNNKNNKSNTEDLLGIDKYDDSNYLKTEQSSNSIINVKSSISINTNNKENSNNKTLLKSNKTFGSILDKNKIKLINSIRSTTKQTKKNINITVKRSTKKLNSNQERVYRHRNSLSSYAYNTETGKLLNKLQEKIEPITKKMIEEKKLLFKTPNMSFNFDLIKEINAARANPKEFAEKILVVKNKLKKVIINTNGVVRFAESSTKKINLSDTESIEIDSNNKINDMKKNDIPDNYSYSTPKKKNNENKYSPSTHNLPSISLNNFKQINKSNTSEYKEHIRKKSTYIQPIRYKRPNQILYSYDLKEKGFYIFKADSNIHLCFQKAYNLVSQLKPVTGLKYNSQISFVLPHDYEIYKNENFVTDFLINGSGRILSSFKDFNVLFSENIIDPLSMLVINIVEVILREEAANNQKTEEYNNNNSNDVENNNEDDNSSISSQEVKSNNNLNGKININNTSSNIDYIFPLFNKNFTSVGITNKYYHKWKNFCVCVVLVSE